MNLKQLKEKELILSLNNAVRVEKKAITDVLLHLQEMQERRVFCDYGYDSLFTFLVREKLYSESEANIRVSAMRLMKRAPEIKKKIEKNDVSLSNAATLNRFLNEEEKGTGKKLGKAEIQDAIKLVEGNTTRDAHSALDDIRKTPPKDRWVKLRIDSVLEKKLQKLRGLTESGISEQNLFEWLVDQKLNELKKVRRSKGSNVFSRYISESVKKHVQKRSGHRCEHVSENGVRCNGTRRLHFDHKIPFSKGGTSDIGNIQHLCAQHNWKKADN